MSNSSDEEGEGQVTMGHLASSRTEPVVRRKEHQRKTLFGGEVSDAVPVYVMVFLCVCGCVCDGVYMWQCSYVDVIVFM